MLSGKLHLFNHVLASGDSNSPDLHHVDERVKFLTLRCLTDTMSGTMKRNTPVSSYMAAPFS